MAVVPANYSLPAPPAGDKATVLTGSFGATGVSPSWLGFGWFNLVFGGSGGPNGNYNATIRLERSFDGGTTWYVCGIGGDGTQAVYSANNVDVSVTVVEYEKGVAYRLNCTVWASGTINYRFSTDGPGTVSGPPGVY